MALLVSLVFMLFLVVGTVSAADVSNVSNTEDSNLISDSISDQKLEISNEDSISQANMVNSHEDNLSDYPDNALESIDTSNYEDNDGEINNSTGDDSNTLSATSDSVLSAKTSTKLTVSSTHYSSAGSVFEVTIKNAKGKALTSQKVSLTIKGKTYSTTSNSKGVATFKTAALAIGVYSVKVTYAGNSKYSKSSLSQKVKVVSSLSGSNMNKYYGYVSTHTVTFYKNTCPLVNTKVSFIVAGKTYTKTTNSKGVASLNVNLAPGEYNITAVNPFSGEKLTNKIVVKKDTTTLKHGTSSTYILPNHKYTFTVTLKSKSGVLISDKKVTFTYNGKQVTTTTDKNGKATITIPVLSKGTYPISYKYDEDIFYYGSSGSGKLYVKDSTTKLTGSDLKMKFSDGSKFSVTLKNSNNKALANKEVKFKLDGKTYTVKTNTKGVAYLNVGALKPATYTVKYVYSSVGSKDYSYGSNKIVVSKQTATISAGDLVMKYNDGSVYKVTVKTKNGNPVKNTSVKFTINGKTYTKTTDSKGVAKLNIGLAIGYYTIKTSLPSTCYQVNAVSKHILVNGTKFSASELYVVPGNNVTYSVKLLDGKSSPIKNANVKFTVNGKTYTKATNSKGIAKVSLGALPSGDYTIKFSQGSYSGSSKIHVIKSVTISQIITASKNVKNYIESNSKLPATVKVGGYTLSTANYLYLASKAIVNLKSGSTGKIGIKNIKSPTKQGSSANLGNLNNYLAVAKKVISTADSKGVMPNYVSSDVGNIGYKGLVYASARVVAFYGDEKVMPAYVTIKTLSGSGSTSSNLNSKNTISNLAAYLAATKNCQVNNSAIKSLVTKLTKGLTSDKAKANAIYNYVRDSISYSFYYDTKHGAVGTLNAKSGNCVDQAHLLTAMFRTAGLATRYVHGTCTFSSGGTYGHVWTQVLIGDTWTVADPTSTRNSFGNVVNWNSNSYSLKGYYASISF